MRLPPAEPDLRRDLEEFDVWITPALGEISATEKFKVEVARVSRVFDELGQATNDFEDIEHCRPDAIARMFASLAVGLCQSAREELFNSLASTLYLVTGKSDNNSKCQFPLYLRDVTRWTELPNIVRRGTDVRVMQNPVPRVLKSDDYMKLVSALDDEIEVSRLLEQFVSFQLMDEAAVLQFWSVGSSYFTLKKQGHGLERSLLAPIVTYKVRGSVSASGGHKPEAILRQQLEEWGLVPDEDFNVADVVVDRGGVGTNEKTRAYDFIVPYRTPRWYPAWEHRIMVQSQFYAGDSGSVSHKNVDQTAISRERVLRKYGSTRFVEYVDGAGYYSSLNGDLRKLLSMRSTHSFFQLRSAPIRFRRELQALGFVTPLEIEHAIIRSSGEEDAVAAVLIADGYHVHEVREAIQAAVRLGFVNKTEASLNIREDRRQVARRYLLLDILAIHGVTLDLDNPAVQHVVMVPGYGPYFGLPMQQLIAHVADQSGDLAVELQDWKTLEADLLFLVNRKYVIVKL